MSTTYIESQDSSAVVEAWKVIDELTDDPRIMALPLADAIRAIATGEALTAESAQAPAGESAAEAAAAADSQEAASDDDLLDWLEEQATISSSGICVDYCYNLDDGQVLEKGWRVMRRHYLGPRGSTLREAIDLARAERAPG